MGRAERLALVDCAPSKRLAKRSAALADMSIDGDASMAQVVHRGFIPLTTKSAH